MSNQKRYTLELFMEQGSEGAHWCIYDNTKTGYDGIIMLREDMKIRIPGVWEGIIKKDTETNRQWYSWCRDFLIDEDYRGILESRGWDTKEMSNSECKDTAWWSYTKQVAGGYECHWLQKGVDPDEWASWFINELEVEIIDDH